MVNYKALNTYNKHSEVLDYGNVILIEIEYVFPLGDRVDVCIELLNGIHVM